MDLGLDGRVCVVTGGTRGIGAAVTRGLRAEGARVLTVARGGADLDLDVTDPGAPEAIRRECEARLGPADVLVNNAGTSEVKALDSLTDADWQRQWELNVMAPMRLMLALAPGMAERGGGRIVNVCSSSGKRPSQSNAAYSVSKAAQLSLSRTFADAYAGQGVLVNAVAPGPVSTGLWNDEGGLADQAAAAKGISREELLEARAADIPLGRFGTEDEIAAVVVVLCSSLASNVAGAAWSVDGGSVPVIL